jgi:hypothetical protein
MLLKLSSRPASSPTCFLNSMTRLAWSATRRESLSPDLTLLYYGYSGVLLIVGSICRDCLNYIVVIFNERHRYRALSLCVDPPGSGGDPFVVMMQSADLRCGDDT